ncbi:MmgE/PrpD family protein [Niallia sp. 01092]|uniref:MmgE/PrpD family protein n=1 Tax=unclassified Niallia TaxID=2837522 RepID=UPI003FD36016
MAVNKETLTAKFVQSILNSDPLASKRVIQYAKMGIIDYLASSYAAKEDYSVKKLCRLIDLEDEKRGAPIIGQSKKASPIQAALINGFIGHALDYDDVHAEVRGHPSTVILPVLFSLAGKNPKIEGARLLAAYIIGVEVMARFGQAVGKDHYVKGWHNTGTLGIIAAAVSGGYLLGFNEEELCKVIGFAATQASGLRFQFGTETKPLHAGLAAQAALQSIDFIEIGLSGSLTGLDGRVGFFSVYGEGADFASPFLLNDWNKSWKIEGLWFKLYPFCSAACHAADAALELMNETSVKIEEMKEITIIYPPGGDAALVEQNPRTGEQGRFSAEYIVASILLQFPLTLEHFQPVEIKAEIKKLMKIIKREYDESIHPAVDSMPKGRFTIVQIVTNSNEIISKRVDAPKGSPNNPLTLDKLKEKLDNSIEDQALSYCLKQIIDNLPKDKASTFLSIL